MVTKAVSVSRPAAQAPAWQVVTPGANLTPRSCHPRRRQIQRRYTTARRARRSLPCRRSRLITGMRSTSRLNFLHVPRTASILPRAARTPQRRTTLTRCHPRQFHRGGHLAISRSRRYRQALGRLHLCPSPALRPRRRSLLRSLMVYTPCHQAPHRRTQVETRLLPRLRRLP